MNKEKTIKVVGGSIFGIVGVVIIALLPIWSDDMTQATESFDNSVPKMSRDESFSIDDIQSFDEDDFKVEDDAFSQSINADDLLDRVSAAKREAGEDSVNENIVNDSLLQEMLDEQEKQDRIDYKAVKEKELSYAEKLAIAREKHFVIREVKDEEEEREKVVFRGYVFRTQYVVPGERVDLMTSEEFIYNNTRFEKGMRFYAMVDIKESRILFDINNIAHVPLKAEVRDIADGRIGLYSKQAGELWAVYQERLKEETRNNVTREVSNGAKTPIISSTIQVLSNFFASKKGRKSKKLKIDNNSQFIVTLL